MFNELSSEECKWSEDDKRNYCENIGNCPENNERIKRLFKQTCYKIKNATNEEKNECSPVLFKCSPKLLMEEKQLKIIGSNKNGTYKDFYKCYCNNIITGKSNSKSSVIDCKCHTHDLVHKKNKKDKVYNKYKNVNARKCVMIKNKKNSEETKFSCFVNNGCNPSCFDSQFQCNTSLCLPHITMQNNYTNPLISTNQEPCYNWELQRFIGQLSFILLYIPIIFMISYLIQQCLEFRHIKLNLDFPKVELSHTLKKHVHKIKELYKKNQEEKDVITEKI